MTKIRININSPEIKFLCDNDKILDRIIKKCGDLQYRLSYEPYEFLIHTIVGQMLSNKVGDYIFKRINKACKGIISPNSILELGKNGLQALGISSRKSKAIILLSQIMIDDNDFFARLNSMDNNEIMMKLTSIQGVGPWTVKMYLIFVLDRRNVLPYEDAAFINAFHLAYNIIDRTRDKKIVQEYCKRWGDYQSIASRYLYKAYDAGILADANITRNEKIIVI